MERKKASDFPQELLDLFHLYVHGDIGRREFIAWQRTLDWFNKYLRA